jgi:hypothetical protein
MELLIAMRTSSPTAMEQRPSTVLEPSVSLSMNHVLRHVMEAKERESLLSVSVKLLL